MIFKYLNYFKKGMLLTIGNLCLLLHRMYGRAIVQGQVRIIGRPILNIDVAGGRLVIGNNVTLNSYNFDYHANMFAGVKIFIEGSNSEIRIGDDTRIHGSCLHARKKITIGKRCLIAANCNIIDSNGHESLLANPEQRFTSVDEPREIIIEDDVWIGMNAVILPGTVIGRGSIVSANSVVKMVVPPKSMVCGNPAVIIKIYQE